MMNQESPDQDLSPLELEIMQLIWEKGEVKSRHILETFDKRSEVSGGKSYERSTIGTYLDRLRLKRYLDRRPGEGREYIYFPLLSKEDVPDLTIKKLMATFDSPGDFLSRFAGAAKLTVEDKNQLRQLARRLEDRSKP